MKQRYVSRSMKNSSWNTAHFFHYHTLIFLYVFDYKQYLQLRIKRKERLLIWWSWKKRFEQRLIMYAWLLNKNSGGECVAVSIRCDVCYVIFFFLHRSLQLVFLSPTLFFNVLLQDKSQYLHLYKYRNILMFFAHAE